MSQFPVQTIPTSPSTDQPFTIFGMNPYLVIAIGIGILIAVGTGIYFALKNDAQSNNTNLSTTTPSGTTPSGTTPSGTTPSGTTPSGTTPSGTTPSGTTPSGTAPSKTPPSTSPSAPQPAPIPAPSPESGGGSESGGLGIGAWIGIGFGGLVVLLGIGFFIKSRVNARANARRMGLTTPIQKQYNDISDLTPTQLAGLQHLINIEKKSAEIVVQELSQKMTTSTDFVKYLEDTAIRIPPNIFKGIIESAAYKQLSSSWKERSQKMKQWWSQTFDRSGLIKNYLLQTYNVTAEDMIDKAEIDALSVYMGKNKIREPSIACDQLIGEYKKLIQNTSKTDKDILILQLRALAKTEFKSAGFGHKQINTRKAILPGKLGFLQNLKGQEFEDIYKFRDCNTPPQINVTEFGFPLDAITKKAPIRANDFNSDFCKSEKFMFDSRGEIPGSARSYARAIMEPIIQKKQKGYLAPKPVPPPAKPGFFSKFGKKNKT